MSLRFSSLFKVATLPIGTVLVLTLVAIGIERAQSHFENVRSPALKEPASKLSSPHSIPSDSASATPTGVGCTTRLQRCPN